MTPCTQVSIQQKYTFAGIQHFSAKKKPDAVKHQAKVGCDTPDGADLENHTNSVSTVRKGVGLMHHQWDLAIDQ
jgi:hypothetical protein